MQLRQASDETFLFCPVETFAKSALEAVEHLVDLRFVDDERWTQRDAVAEQRARDDAFLLDELRDGGGRHLRRLETRLRLFVGDEFDAADEADALRFADQRMLAELGEPRLETRRHVAHMAHDV